MNSTEALPMRSDADVVRAGPGPQKQREAEGKTERQHSDNPRALLSAALEQRRDEEMK